MPFVDRRRELDRIVRLALETKAGRPERHLALVGVRRIGKSRIIEHYRDGDPEVAVVYVQMDSATATVPIFLRSMARATVNALAARRGIAPLPRSADDRAVAALAGALGSPVAEQVLRAHAAAAARRTDEQHLLELGLTLPEALAGATGEPFLVAADEFQHIADLAVYAPFAGGRRRSSEDARRALLGVVRAHLERPAHVGWVVTGSSVRLLQHMLGEGPLMGRFDVVLVPPFDEEDCQQLATALWEEAGVDATPQARARLFRLTQGHPFYADVTCREAANIARRLEQPVSGAMVDGAFVAAVLQPHGQIAIACREMYDSLGTRTPGLRGFLDALAPAEPASLPEIGERLGIASLRSVYRFADDLAWMGVVEEVEPGRYGFADPVFRYWIARANDPVAMPPPVFDPGAARRIARGFEEAYLREREIHGTLSEGFVRDTCRSFAGQRLDGRRFGRPGTRVRLPVVDQVTSVAAFDAAGTVHGRPSEVELDLQFGTDQVWLGEVKRTAARATAADIGLLVRKARFLREALALPDGPLWFVSFHGFEGAALEAARASGVHTSNLQDLRAIRAAVATRR